MKSLTVPVFPASSCPSEEAEAAASLMYCGSESRFAQVARDRSEGLVVVQSPGCSGEVVRNEGARKEWTVLWNLLQNPNRADRRALMVFFAIALLLALYFASGILVGYVSPPADLIEMAREEPGWAVRVSRLPTFDAASQLTAAIRNQRRLEAVIEGAPSESGYQVRIGPVATREMADLLVEELTTSGYTRIDILESIERDR